MRTTPRVNPERKLLSANLSRQVSHYSLAATAAGVGLLALASPADGEVVVTKRNIPIPVTQFGQPSLGISLANNGVNDFNFHVLSTFSFESTRFERILEVGNAPGGRGFMGSFKIGGYHVYASALARGAKIGPSQQFQDLRQGDAIEVSYTTFSGGHRLLGKWDGDPKNRYLGVRFSLDGETHFG
jgi:hypothetical protein